MLDIAFFIIYKEKTFGLVGEFVFSLRTRLSLQHTPSYALVRNTTNALLGICLKGRGVRRKQIRDL